MGNGWRGCAVGVQEGGRKTARRSRRSTQIGTGNRDGRRRCCGNWRGRNTCPTQFPQRYPSAANRSRNSAARTYRRKVRAASFVQALAHSVPAGPVPSPPGAISARGATWRESFGGYSRRAILATSPSPSHSLYLSRRSLGEGGSAQICGHLRATPPHKKL